MMYAVCGGIILKTVLISSGTELKLSCVSECNKNAHCKL